MIEQHRESTSVGREVSYYASFELFREVSEHAKTVRFRRADDGATNQLVRAALDDLGTVPFVKQSSPYEKIDIHELVDGNPHNVAFGRPEPITPRVAAAVVGPRGRPPTAPVVLARSSAAAIEPNPNDTSELELSDMLAVDATTPFAEVEPPSEDIHIDVDVDFEPSHTLTMSVDDHARFANDPLAQPLAGDTLPTIVPLANDGWKSIASDVSHAIERIVDTSEPAALVGQGVPPAQNLVAPPAQSFFAQEIPPAQNLVAPTPDWLVARSRAETELVTPRGVSTRFVVFAALLLVGAFALGVGIPFLVA